jgi:hypothetical protein
MRMGGGDGVGTVRGSKTRTVGRAGVSVGTVWRDDLLADRKNMRLLAVIRRGGGDIGAGRARQ